MSSSVPVQVRLFLSTNPGFHKSADIAKALGLETKQVSSALSRLFKQDRVVRENSMYADPENQESQDTTPADPEPSGDDVEDLIGEVGDSETKEDDTLFYESLDFPGNYSIVMAPFAVQIAEAAGVPAKIETFGNKLVRRVHFGGTDMDLTTRTVNFVKEEAAAALGSLRVWQKENIERRRGLTDMQRYLEHREFLAKHGAKAAKQVKKQGL